MYSKIIKTMFFFIAGCCLQACNGRKQGLAKIAGEYAEELQQEKKTKAGTVTMLLMPLTGTDTGATDNLYRIRLTLRTNQPVKKAVLMQYMNFDIRNSFRCIRGTDTLPCIICERVPGISENDFIYMTCFNKTGAAANAGKNLQLCVTDTVMGFGSATFDINNEALKKLAQ